MDTNNFEEEIDFLNLAKHILSKWKSLLVAGLCFSALGFGYKYYKTEFSIVPLEEVDKLFEIERVNEKGTIEKHKVNYNLYVEDYKAKLSQYNAALKSKEERKRVLESEILKIEDSISNSEIYNRESILLKMDPASFSKISKTIIIFDNVDGSKLENNDANSDASGEQRTTSLNSTEIVKTYKIERRDSDPYIQHLESYMMSSVLSDKVRTLLNKKKEKIDSYVRELYGFEHSKDSLIFFAQSDSDKLSKSIIELIENELKTKLSELLLPGMSYRIVDTDAYNGFSQQVFNMQLDKKNSFEALLFQLADKRSQIDRILTPIKPEMLAMNPNGPVSIENYKLKNIVIFSLAGFVFGILALSGLYTILYFFSGKIRDKSLFARGLGIRTLAVFSSEKDEISLRVLSEKLDAHAKGMKNVALVTSLDCKYFCYDAIISLLKNKGISVVVANADQISNIANSDAVIFLEKIDVSRVSAVIEEIDLVKELNTEILGFAYFL